MTTKLFTSLMAAAVLAAAPAYAQDQYPNPSKRLDWTIAFGPGGGNDIMSRTIISILEKYKLYPGTIVAENRPGGSGAKGWGYVFSQKGDPYYITSTSGSLLGSSVIRHNIKCKCAQHVPMWYARCPACGSYLDH